LLWLWNLFLWLWTIQSLLLNAIFYTLRLGLGDALKEGHGSGLVMSSWNGVDSGRRKLHWVISVDSVDSLDSEGLIRVRELGGLILNSPDWTSQKGFLLFNNFEEILFHEGILFVLGLGSFAVFLKRET
jgi:hypothetical protein